MVTPSPASDSATAPGLNCPNVHSLDSPLVTSGHAFYQEDTTLSLVAPRVLRGSPLTVLARLLVEA